MTYWARRRIEKRCFDDQAQHPIRALAPDQRKVDLAVHLAHEDGPLEGFREKSHRRVGARIVEDQRPRQAGIAGLGDQTRIRSIVVEGIELRAAITGSGPARLRCLEIDQLLLEVAQTVVLEEAAVADRGSRLSATGTLVNVPNVPLSLLFGLSEPLDVIVFQQGQVDECL